MSLLDNNSLVVIAGPTASGKSQMALDLAQEIGGEIISADSMQLYKELNIGTAKVSKAEQELVRHHLIDIYDMSVKSDVFKFVELARNAIDDIKSRNKTPIICGGTGFYIKALLYGLDDLPGDEQLKKELELEFAGEEGLARLKLLMQSIDPLSYEKYQNYHRKLLRALEVKKLTGKSLVELQKDNSKLIYPNVKSFWIDHDRDLLKDRISTRSKIMLKAGWIEEAEDLIAKGLLNTPSAWQALGYSTIGDYLNGKYSYNELEERISTTTWQFARRQLTWFRHQHPESISIKFNDYKLLKELI